MREPRGLTQAPLQKARMLGLVLCYRFSDVLKCYIYKGLSMFILHWAPQIVVLSLLVNSRDQRRAQDQGHREGRRGTTGEPVEEPTES